MNELLLNIINCMNLRNILCEMSDFQLLPIVILLLLTKKNLKIINKQINKRIYGLWLNTLKAKSLKK